MTSPETARSVRFTAVGLAVVLLLCIARLWLMELPSSFWVDETVTAFVVHRGADDPSLAVAPQVTKSIYYGLPRAAEELLGFSEIVYRLPSILLMAVTLFLVSHLAMRLIHPQAGWFAVFACLALRGINYEAADARPYALGMCFAAASLLFLVRWLDFASWTDAILFVAFAALLWRVHLIFWPVYIVFALYAGVRLIRNETRVGWPRAALVFALIGVALLPVLLDALPLYREAKAHVIVLPPTWTELRQSLKFGLFAACAGAWILSKCFGWPRAEKPPFSAFAAFVGFWLIHPLVLFAFSRLTGDSVFIARYLSVALPGTALAATISVAPFIPAAKWKPLALVFGVGVLVFLGQWRQPWPMHHNSDWRAASAKINALGFGPDLPVVCPSPFIEARWPVWRPNYPLPGFLYSQLSAYPVLGKTLLLPFEKSPEAEQYAAELSAGIFPAAGHFVIYGGDLNVRRWRDWFAARPELAKWTHRGLGPFGDVDAVLFEGQMPPALSSR